MAAGRITVRERIDPDITASMFSNYRSSADAVMELIDNAVDSRLPGAPLTIDITVHPASLIVFAEGGEGMGLRELERNYLRWGGSPKRGRHLLGQYGQGGKAAIGHLGRRFTVEAARPGDALAWRFTDNDYRDRSRLKTYDVDEVPKRTATEVGYVRIRIDAVDKRVDSRRLSQRLAETYRPLIGGGVIAIRLNTSPVLPVAPAVLERRAVGAYAAGGRLRGWIGLADPERPAQGWAPGIRCYKLGRLVADGEFFGHPGPAQVPAMVRLIGEVDIPRVGLTMNKSDFDRDSPAWVDVEERMRRVLAPLVRRLEREADAPPPASAAKVAEQVRRLLSQALRMSERADLFAGLAAAGASSRPPEHRDGELPLEAVPKETRDSSGRVSPPAAASMRQVRRGFGTIVIRALDPVSGARR
jgi:hypothetical protein